MFELSDEGVEFIKREMGRYETKRSAVIPALYRAQRENGGWVSPEVVECLSRLMDIPPAHIDEVLEFYTMFNKAPVGRHHLQVCCNVSCALAGGREIASHLGRILGVKEGQVTPDGLFSVSRVECLGSCDTGPVLQVNAEPFEEKLTTEAVDRLVEKLRSGS